MRYVVFYTHCTVCRGFVQLQTLTPLICIRKPRAKKRRSDTSSASDDVMRQQQLPAMQYEQTFVSEHLVSIPKVIM